MGLWCKIFKAFLGVQNIFESCLTARWEKAKSKQTRLNQRKKYLHIRTLTLDFLLFFVLLGST